MSKKISKFFEQSKEHSRVKTQIVAKYFVPWLRIMKKRCTESITYLDLFSGSGIYDDGSPSTPMYILDEIHKQPDVFDRMKLRFFEINKKNFTKLENSIKAHPVYNLLKTKPEIHNTEIDEAFVDELIIDSCTFAFIDPCGYKGMSLDLILKVFEEWGSDCIINLNTSGLIRNVEDDNKSDDMIRIFESEYHNLRKAFKTATSSEDKDKLMINAILMEMKRISGVEVYHIEFGMKFEDKDQNRYCLLFVTKNKTGLRIMRDIMNNVSSKDTSNVPMIGFKKSKKDNDQQLSFVLDDYSVELIKLAMRFSKDYHKKSMTVSEFMDSVWDSGCTLSAPHLRDALELLKSQGKVEIINIPKPKPKLTFGDRVTFKFK